MNYEEDRQKDEYANGVAQRAQMTQDDPPSTLTVMSVAFSQLVAHGLAQDERVDRLIGELHGTYAGLKRADHRLERSRRAHIDALKRVDDLEKQLAESEEARTAQAELIGTLQGDITLRESLLGRAHRLLVTVDVTRMAPQSTRIQWRRDMKSFKEAYEVVTRPSAPSQAAEAYSAAVLPDMVVIADEATLKAALDGGQIATEAPAPDPETARRLRRERKEAAGRVQAGIPDEDFEEELEEEDPEDGL